MYTLYFKRIFAVYTCIPALFVEVYGVLERE